MPDIPNPQPNSELNMNPFKVGDKVVYNGSKWIVLNPMIGIQDDREIALIGRGPYNALRLSVYIDMLTFSK